MGFATVSNTVNSVRIAKRNFPYISLLKQFSYGWILEMIHPYNSNIFQL